MIRYRKWSWLLLLALATGSQAQEIAFDDCRQEVAEPAIWRVKAALSNQTLLASEDLLRVSACQRENFDQLVEQVERLFRIEMVTVSRSKGAMPPSLPADLCGTEETCSAELYVPKASNIELPFSKSGGLPFASLLGHLGKAGHFELSKSSAKDAGFSAKASALLADASRDADFLEWTNPAAHAQTPNDANAMLVGDPKTNKAAFQKWVADKHARAVRACQDGDYSKALYLVGYALHGVQDLAFHEGMSNAEHSHADNIQNRNIDSQERYDSKFALAKRLSDVLLVRFKRSIKPDCWSKLLSGEGVQSLGRLDRPKAVGVNGYDFTRKTYREYQELATLVTKGLAPNTDPSKYILRPKWLPSKSTANVAAKLVEGIPLAVAGK